jgi:hypothetical protein
LPAPICRVHGFHATFDHQLAMGSVTEKSTFTLLQLLSFALHLALSLTEILLDLALGFLGPTLHMFARVASRLTEITAKLALGFLHLARRLVLKTALVDGRTSPD